MGQTDVEAFRAEVNAGIDAVVAGRRDEGAARFQQALDLAGAIADPGQRREELVDVVPVLRRMAMPELALMAAQEAVFLDEERDDRARLADDLLVLGTALHDLGDQAGAAKAYEEALGIFTAAGDRANAASASTNLAVMVGNAGDMDRAIRLLFDSLGHVAEEPFDETEIITRIALVQALEAEGRDPEALFAVADPLLGRFADRLRPDQRDGVLGPLRQAIGRHLAAHPELDGGAWVAARFPMLG